MKMQDLIRVGWREQLALPDLGIDVIHAKVDSGAKTSCLHAFFVDDFSRGGVEWVRFGVHPVQRSNEQVKICEAELLDRRHVSDSGGHKDLRHVIATHIKIGELYFKTELTLTNRDSMQFRMLLGRRSMTKRMLIDPAASYLQGKS